MFKPESSRIEEETTRIDEGWSTIIVKVNKLFDNRSIEFQEVQKAMIFPVVPDLTKKKSTVLDKSTPSFQLLSRQLALKQLAEQAHLLAVSFS